MKDSTVAALATVALPTMEGGSLLRLYVLFIQPQEPVVIHSSVHTRALPFTASSI